MVALLGPWRLNPRLSHTSVVCCCFILRQVLTKSLKFPRHGSSLRSSRLSFPEDHTWVQSARGSAVVELRPPRAGHEEKPGPRECPQCAQHTGAGGQHGPLEERGPGAGWPAGDLRERGVTARTSRQAGPSCPPDLSSRVWVFPGVELSEEAAAASQDAQVRGFLLLSCLSCTISGLAHGPGQELLWPVEGPRRIVWEAGPAPAAAAVCVTPPPAPLLRVRVPRAWLPTPSPYTSSAHCSATPALLLSSVL